MNTIRFIRNLAAMAVLGVATLAPRGATAQTLLFDDVSTNAQGLNNNFASYNGFEFFGWNVATASALGTGTNAVSGTKFALGREDLSSVYRSGPAFNFFDAWLSFRQFDATSPDNSPIGINVVGYRAGVAVPVFTQFITLTGTAQLFEFNFFDIEEVVFETESLTGGGRTVALAMDNARLAVVPEPATLLLVAIGCAGVLLVARARVRRG